MQIKNQKAGFTLVELIVVLVILGILAGILVPTMLGWIRDAKEEQVLLYANTAFKAAQSSLLESYGLDPEFNYGATVNKIKFWGGEDKTYTCGYLTNLTFSRIQKNPNATGFGDKVGGATQKRLANSVLNYLGASKNNTSKFNFDENAVNSNISQAESSATKVAGITDKKTSLIIAWNSKAEILFFSFVYDQCMVMYCPHLSVDSLQIISLDDDLATVTGGNKGSDKKVTYGVRFGVATSSDEPEPIIGVEVNSIVDVLSKVLNKGSSLDSGAAFYPSSKLYHILNSSGNNYSKSENEELRANLESIGATSWAYKKDGNKQCLYWTDEDISTKSVGETVQVKCSNGKSYKVKIKTGNLNSDTYNVFDLSKLTEIPQN